MSCDIKAINTCLSAGKTAVGLRITTQKVTHPRQSLQATTQSKSEHLREAVQVILTESSWRFATRRVLVTVGIRTVVAFVRLMCVALVTALTAPQRPWHSRPLAVERPPFRIDFDTNHRLRMLLTFSQ